MVYVEVHLSVKQEYQTRMDTKGRTVLAESRGGVDPNAFCQGTPLGWIKPKGTMLHPYLIFSHSFSDKSKNNRRNVIGSENLNTFIEFDQAAAYDCTYEVG